MIPHNERSKASKLLTPEITQMLEQRRTHDARAALSKLAIPEIADLLTELKSQYCAVAFWLLPRERAADV